LITERSSRIFFSRPLRQRRHPRHCSSFPETVREPDLTRPRRRRHRRRPPGTSVIKLFLVIMVVSKPIL